MIVRRDGEIVIDTIPPSANFIIRIGEGKAIVGDVIQDDIHAVHAEGDGRIPADNIASPVTMVDIESRIEAATTPLREEINNLKGSNIALCQRIEVLEDKFAEVSQDRYRLLEWKKALEMPKPTGEPGLHGSWLENAPTGGGGA